MDHERTRKDKKKSNAYTTYIYFLKIHTKTDKKNLTKYKRCSAAMFVQLPRSNTRKFGHDIPIPENNA